jgi:hypothetical protein
VNEEKYMITEQQIEKVSKALGNKPVVLVPYKEVEGAEWNMCFANVKAVVEQNGGSAQYGWGLTTLKESAVVLAVHHAVWKKDDELIDVTPDDDYATKDGYRYFVIDDEALPEDRETAIANGSQSRALANRIIVTSKNSNAKKLAIKYLRFEWRISKHDKPAQFIMAV